VRELENIISRASVLNINGSITAYELRGWLSLHGSPIGTLGVRTEINAADISLGPDEEMPFGLSLEAMERKLIEATLERFGGHRAKAAQALGIGLRTLSGKLKQYGYAPRTKAFAKAG
jgi:DNA-binding NtrC family response regulator